MGEGGEESFFGPRTGVLLTIRLSIGPRTVDLTLASPLSLGISLSLSLRLTIYHLSLTHTTTMVALFRRPASFASALFTVRRVAAFSSSVVSPPTAFARSQSNNAACRYASASALMMTSSFQVIQFPCLSDNYG